MTRLLCLGIMVLMLLSASLCAQAGGLIGSSFDPSGVAFPTDKFGAPGGNPLTASKVDLGRLLFWDAQLSADNSVACGSCHLVGQSAGANPFSNAIGPGEDGVMGTADDSHGAFGVVDMDGSRNYQRHSDFEVGRQVTPRNPPTMINAAFFKRVLWDLGALKTFTKLNGRVVLLDNAALESQAAGPPQNPTEMGHSGISTSDQWDALAAKIATSLPIALSPDKAMISTFAPNLLISFGTTYSTLFDQVFGAPMGAGLSVTREKIAMAIATYERTLISNGGPFDQFLAGNQSALSPSAQRGFNIFRSNGSQCDKCHSSAPGGFFTGEILVPFAYPAPFSPADGFPIGNPAPLDGLLSDGFRHNIFNGPFGGNFKTPSLRNMALRPRYFHGGNVGGLGNIVNFYNNPNLTFSFDDPDLPGSNDPLDIADLRAVADFFLALTDPAVANETGAFAHPRLHSELAPNPPLEFGAENVGTHGALQPITLSAATSNNLVFQHGVGNTTANSQLFLGVSTAILDPPVLIGGGVPVNVDIFNPANGSLTAIGNANWTGTGAVPGDGVATIVTTLPPVLIGTPLHMQWFVRDLGALGGTAASKGLTLQLF